MEIFLAIKKPNKDMSFVGKWVQPKIIIVNELWQSQKDKYQMFSSFVVYIVIKS